MKKQSPYLVKYVLVSDTDPDDWSIMRDRPDWDYPSLTPRHWERWTYRRGGPYGDVLANREKIKQQEAKS